MGEPKDIHVGIMMMGEPGVGKSQLTDRYVDDEFSPDYIITKKVRIKHKEVKNFEPFGYTVYLHVYDLTGHSKKSVEIAKDKAESLGGIHGLLVVSDALRTYTLDEEAIAQWLETTIDYVGEMPLSILINKADLLDRKQFAKWYDSQERKNFLNSLRKGIITEYEYNQKQQNDALDQYAGIIAKWSDMRLYENDFGDEVGRIDAEVRKINDELERYNVKCIKTSAKTGLHVEMVFLELIGHVIEKNLGEELVKAGRDEILRLEAMVNEVAEGK